MPATIRLQRVGRKKQSSFRIVVTEKTLARGGPALEILGTYNPRTEPSSIRFDAARALHWLRAGALPSESVESIFRKTGVMKQFRSGVEPESLTETLITIGSPFGGGKTSQRGKHGGPPSPEKLAAEAAASAAAEAPVEEVVEEAVEEAPAEEAVEEAAEEVTAEAAEAAAEVEEAVEEIAEEAAADGDEAAEEVEAAADEVVADAEEAVEEVTAEAEAEVKAAAEVEAAEEVADEEDEKAEKEGS